MSIKEIWGYLLGYNLIKLLMAQSALLAEIIPRKISFKHCLQLWSTTMQHLDNMDVDQQSNLFSLIALQKMGKRPCGIEARAVRMRLKTFPMLMKSRTDARTTVKKNGPEKTQISITLTPLLFT